MCPMVRRPPGIELALLGFLREGPQHGYQVHQMLNDPHGLGPIWKMKQSQLYSLLGKLESDGLTWGVLQPQETARPPRRVYHLTRMGQTAFQKWLRSPVTAPREMRQEFMAKLYFARMEGPAHTKTLLVQQRSVCQVWLNSFKAEKNEPGTFAASLLEYRIGQIESTLKWLDNLK